MKISLNRGPVISMVPLNLLKTYRALRPRLGLASSARVGSAASILPAVSL